MGCISSKVITRSLSFQEEPNQMGSRRNRMSNGKPLLQELFTSANGSDQFFALVCTGNTVANKLRTRGFNFQSNEGPKPPLESTNTETINTWELMAGLEEEVQTWGPIPTQEIVRSTLDNDKIKRSKSCRWSPENIEVASPLVPGLNEEGFKWGKRSLVRSRSYHTVEEYDAMLEKIWVSRAHETGVDDDEYDSASCKAQLQPPQASTKKNYADQIQETGESFLRNKDSIRENMNRLMSEATSVVDTKEVVSSLNNNYEKGLKRKAMAKELESLKIPPAIEFPTPTVTNLRKWVHVGGQVYSPGAYVTPKFGSYNRGSGKERREESIFNSELVTAFEECMQHLEEEEEKVLKQIEANPEEDATKEKETQEEISIQD